MAFNYKSHLDYSPVTKLSDNPHHLSNTRKPKQPGFCDGLYGLLTSTTDVIDDTRNTFIKSYDDEVGDKETQLDELMRLRDSFNWSDEELLDVRDMPKKGKHNKENLPKVKGGKSQSIGMQAYQSIKKTVSGSADDFRLKRRKSDGDGSKALEAIKEYELQDRSSSYKTPDLL